MQTSSTTSLRRLPDARRLPGCEDRRNSSRVNRTIPIRYRVRGLTFRKSFALSLGASGARIITADPVQKGQKIHLTFELSPEWHVPVVGSPVWYQPIAGGRAWVVGLSFYPLREEDSGRLRRWIRSQEPRPLVS
jgi:hypothetical protein